MQISILFAQFPFVSSSVEYPNGSGALEILIHTLPFGMRCAAGVVFPYQTSGSL